jgi:hypothetical protein
MTMRYVYNRHEITIISDEITPGQWNLTVAVMRSDGEIPRSTPFTLMRLFNTYEEAAAYGFTWAKDLIDR